MAITAHGLTPSQISQLAQALAVFPHHLKHPELGPLHIDNARQLCEHLSLWNLTKLRALRPGERLAALAQDSGALHHQIRHGDQPYQWAWSEPNASGDGRRVLGVFTGDLSSSVHRGLRWIDSSVPTQDDEQVRLLCVPSLRIHALWIAGESQDQLALIHNARAPLRAPTKFEIEPSSKFMLMLKKMAANLKPWPFEGEPLAQS